MSTQGTQAAMSTQLNQPLRRAERSEHVTKPTMQKTDAMQVVLNVAFLKLERAKQANAPAIYCAAIESTADEIVEALQGKLR